MLAGCPSLRHSSASSTSFHRLPFDFPDHPPSPTFDHFHAHPLPPSLMTHAPQPRGFFSTLDGSDHLLVDAAGPPHQLFENDRSSVVADAIGWKFAACSREHQMLAFEDIWSGEMKVSPASSVQQQIQAAGKEYASGQWPLPLLSGDGYHRLNAAAIIQSPPEYSNEEETAADLMMWGSTNTFHNHDFDNSTGDLVDAIMAASSSVSSQQQPEGVFSGADSARGSCSPPSSSVHLVTSHPDHEFSSPISDPSSSTAVIGQPHQQQGSPPTLMQFRVHPNESSAGRVITCTSSPVPQASHYNKGSFVPQFCTEKIPQQSSMEIAGSCSHLKEMREKLPTQQSVEVLVRSHFNQQRNNATGFRVSNPCARVSSSPMMEVGGMEIERRRIDGAREREEAVEIINLLASCVEAISAGDLTAVNHLLARLGRQASPTGRSPVHRMASYFTEALACRVSKLWPQFYHPLSVAQLSQAASAATQTDLFSGNADPSTTAWQVLNGATPLVKFSQYTANEMILQAFQGEDRVHVIDLDIKEGLQWPALFHSLLSRPGGPPKLIRLTGIGECKEDVQDAGDRLAEFAEEMGLNFEFHGVVDKLEDVRLWMLHVKQEPAREAVAVNCVLQLHRALRDETGDEAAKILSLIRSTKPKVVAVVEQEADCEGGKSMEARCAAAMRYFAALFDAMEGSESGGGGGGLLSAGRRLIAEAYFGEQIRNIVACDGEARVERYETMQRWRKLLSSEGFQSLPVSDRAWLQASFLLRMSSSSTTTQATTRYSLDPATPPGSTTTLHPDHDHLTLLWADQPLLTASAWTPSELP